MLEPAVLHDKEAIVFSFRDTRIVYEIDSCKYAVTLADISMSETVAGYLSQTSAVSTTVYFY